ncbi:MAG: hypothetical protein AAB873_02095 [Patescibacteria group bacterium]
MKNDVTIYKPRKSVMGGGLVMLLVLFFGLTLPAIIEGSPLPKNELFGLLGFWFIGLVVTFLPLAFKIEIGVDYVKTYFFKFQLRDLRPANIQVLEYGNILRGGLGVGKGIKGWEKTRNGNLKYFSIGETGYGKEAIAHAKRVLENNK